MDTNCQLGLSVSHTIKLKITSESNGQPQPPSSTEMTSAPVGDIKIHSQSFQAGHELADLIAAVDALQADASSFLSAQVAKKPERS